MVAFHPDQATEPAIDLAIALRVPFAVVPCCVFPSEFPDRCFDGRPVRTYAEFIAFLQRKHPRIRTEALPFTSEAGTARSLVLYMTADDLRDSAVCAPAAQA